MLKEDSIHMQTCAEPALPGVAARKGETATDNRKQRRKVLRQCEPNPSA
jgi:hypothetical protein